MMKRLIVAILAVTISFGMIGCSGGSVADVYDNEKKIASSSNSYSLVNCNQEINGAKYHCYN